MDQFKKAIEDAMINGTGEVRMLSSSEYEALVAERDGLKKELAFQMKFGDAMIAERDRYREALEKIAGPYSIDDVVFERLDFVAIARSALGVASTVPKLDVVKTKAECYAYSETLGCRAESLGGKCGCE